MPLCTAKGHIIYYNEQAKTIAELISFIAIAVSYLELIEEMTATEMIQFH